MTKHATYKKYKPYIDLIIEDLGLTDKVELIWIFRTYNSMGGCALLSKKQTIAGKRIGKVNIDNSVCHHDIVRIIMHELRHIQQYYTNRLDSEMVWKETITKRGKIKWIPYRKWDDQEYKHINLPRSGKSTTEYDSLPWEADAESYEKHINRLFPNDTIPIREYIGTIGKIKFYKIKKGAEHE